jgi:hypothetical protein
MVVDVAGAVLIVGVDRGREPRLPKFLAVLFPPVHLRVPVTGTGPSER